MKHGKKYNEVKKLVEKTKAYPLAEAVELLKKVNYAKFDAGIELAVKTNANPKYNDQMLRATTILPHGTGKTKKVAVFTTDDKTEEAKKAEELRNKQAAEKKAKADKLKASASKAPSIKLSLTQNGKIIVKVSDKDKDISFVRYAVGNKSVSYFNKGKKGVKLILNTKNEKTLKLKKGIYTFYAVDKKGNRTIRVVSIE